ncbi:hypothetical protein AB0N07_23420 [Streptomyces sp. NPDC051172]|uniref:hypothetical protein n=1 Tax=Streptomyces sp. NPDC051172 TaxID=3155796 RepID=UPI0034302648
MRLYADRYISKVGGLASPGVDELRRVRPVRPGDSLSLRATVRESRPSRSNDPVLTMTAVNFLPRRTAAG